VISSSYRALVTTAMGQTRRCGGRVYVTSCQLRILVLLQSLGTHAAGHMPPKAAARGPIGAAVLSVLSGSLGLVDQGITVRPAKSRTLVLGPGCLAISAELPTARILPLATATASAIVKAGSTVTTLPFVSIVSAI
jgi:hypothetical protein